MQQEQPFRFFLPNRAQADMIEAVGKGPPDKRIYLVTSGNGSGKTTCVINILANIIMGQVNRFQYAMDVEKRTVFHGFFNHALYNNFPIHWPRRVWYVSNKDSLQGIWEEFQKWIPRKYYIPSKGGKTYVSNVYFPGYKWLISFKTVDQDPETFESANISVVVFDEPPPLKLYRASIARLRTGGIVIIPATPLFSAAWFVDEIIDKTVDDGDKYHQTVRIWDNCIETAGLWYLGKKLGYHPKGCLHKIDVDFMVRNWDPDEREARENGKFMHMVGLVYKTYRNMRTRSKPYSHLVRIKQPAHPQTYVYQFIVDPHDRRPASAIWIRVDQYGRRRVIREWPSVEDDLYQHRMFHKINSADPYIIKDFVKKFIEIEEELGIPNDRIQSIMDPNFGRKRSEITGRLCHEEYEIEFDKQKRPRGFITTANDDLYYGHKAVKALLKPTPNGDLYLLIDESCKNTDLNFRRYAYLEFTGKSAEGKDISIKVKDQFKHYVDLVRYGVVVPIEWWPIEQPTARMREDYEYGDTSIYDKTAARPEGARGI